MEHELEILTEQQRQAWTMRRQGLTYKGIAEAMSITPSAASQLVHDAERRFREYEKYQRMEAKNEEVIRLELTRGELKLLIHLLEGYASKGSFSIHEEAPNDWQKSLGYEFSLVPDLHEKLQMALNGKLIIQKEPERDD